MEFVGCGESSKSNGTAMLGTARERNGTTKRPASGPQSTDREGRSQPPTPTQCSARAVQTQELVSGADLEDLVAQTNDDHEDEGDEEALALVVLCLLQGCCCLLCTRLKVIWGSPHVACKHTVCIIEHNRTGCVGRGGGHRGRRRVQHRGARMASAQCKRRTQDQPSATFSPPHGSQRSQRPPQHSHYKGELMGAVQGMLGGLGRPPLGHSSTQRQREGTSVGFVLLLPQKKRQWRHTHPLAPAGACPARPCPYSAWPLGVTCRPRH